MTVILVVEDEALIAGDIQRTLVRLGYEVPVTVGTGQGAIDSVAKAPPALVLMDIKLRGKMDGIEAAAEIRARFGTPIVYLTSHSDDATLSRAVETRPYGYLLKPFDDRELRTAVAVALQKHELESRLAVRERWFSTTLRSIGDAVIATDPNQTILFMNGVAEQLTGWGSEAIGRPLSEVFRLVDSSGAPIPSTVPPLIDQTFSVRVMSDAALFVKSGGHITINDTVAPIVDENGNVLGGVVVFRDITERRKLEARLARSERLASLGTMAAGVAHEINNPLAYVIVNVAMSRDWVTRAIEELRGSDTKPPSIEAALATLAEVQDALREGGDGADRVRLIVQDLKKFIGSEETTREILDLPNVLEAAIKLTNNTVKHHARVRRSFGTTPYVEANDVQLGQIFTNLLVNAAQAIGEGNASKHEISVSTHTDAAGQAVVEVRDSGPGLRPDVLPKIFDPFFTTKPVGGGMGLGLSISSSLVASLGGQLTAENPPGGGALFRVTLPAASPRHVPKGESAASPGRRGKVLVIDDELAVGTALGRLLRALHDVTVVSDAREGLARIAAGDSFDVVFCDLMMPGISGIDVYESIVVANPEQAKRIVFMTGGAFTPRASAFLESVPNVQLAKPFDVATVRTIAREHVT